MHNWFSSFVIILEHYGAIGLFILSFVEASFFPLPPFLLLIPLTMANPQFGVIYALIATAGSVLGGVFGYVIGFRVGRPVLTHILRPIIIKRLEPIFSQYGGWAIIIGGLIPIPYKIFSITAGVFRIPIFTFLMTSSISRIIHFFSGVLLIILYGPRVALYMHRSLGHTMLVVCGLIILVLLLFWHTKFIQQKLLPLLQRFRQLWQHWAVGINKNLAIFSRFGWYLITGATLTVFGFWFFHKLAKELLAQELSHFDQLLDQAIISLRVPWLTLLMTVVSNCGSILIIILLAVLLTVVGIIYRRFLIDFLVLDICVGGAFGLTELLKATFHRIRPMPPWLISASGYSFPSGHTLLTISLYGFLAYLLIRNKNYLKFNTQLALGFLLLALLVGVSRVYLGVHFPSDVVAGWAVGAAWLGTCIAGREVLRKVVRDRYNQKS